MFSRRRRIFGILISTAFLFHLSILLRHTLNQSVIKVNKLYNVSQINDYHKSVSKVTISHDERAIITNNTHLEGTQMKIKPNLTEINLQTRKRPVNMENVLLEQSIPLWQQKVKDRTYMNKTKVFLCEVLQVRIYKRDLAKWSLAELKQWMHYMFWSGVEHIYLCDHYEFSYEKLDVPLKSYIDLGLITYISKHFPRNAMEAQVECYQYVIDHYKNNCTWQIAVDMDEYPYVEKDTKEDFLVRYLQKQPASVTELSMHNFLMLGQGDRSKNMTIERITRMTPKPANNLDKPIYRPKRVDAQIHHNILKAGNILEIDDYSLRMLHYWGARLQNWGPDTEKTISMTVEFPYLRDNFADKIRNSLLSFGEDDAFSQQTGP